MALTYTSEPITARYRPRLHIHLKHRHNGVLCFFLTGIFQKRNLIFLSILYILGLINCAGRLLTILHPPPPPIPGSLYRSQELFLNIWPGIQSDNGSTVELDNIWRYRRKLKEQRTCSNANARLQPVSSGLQRYLVVEANGGLNQQRSSICNAVAVAGLLNATLVIPRFDLHNVWKDPSVFADIYDEDYFISSLKDFVNVVHDLPKELMDSYNSSISNIPNFRVQAWASARYYTDEIYPVLQESGVVRISPFANRLSTSIPPNIQFLRCLANYKALRFSSTILSLSKKLVNRMIAKSLNSRGKYVSVHLRFEEDMVAFSCCVYDGGEREKSELSAIRQKGWAKKFLQKDRIFAPDLNRVNGRCPMTPVEVGMIISWGSFKDEMETMLVESDRKSIMVPRVKKSTRKGSVYLNPLPECRCLWGSQNSTAPFDMF
ncbi:hypothetical protein OROHE_018610 [Orobanche hederae]